MKTFVGFRHRHLRIKISEHIGVERLGLHTLERVSPEIRTILIEEFGLVTWNTRTESWVRSSFDDEKIDWLFPYVPFENRPNVSAEDAARIVDARNQYTQTLKHIAEQYERGELSSDELAKHLDAAEMRGLSSRNCGWFSRPPTNHDHQITYERPIPSPIVTK